MSVALVLGGANCVWDDVNAALALGEFDGVVACNDAGSAWPGELDAWVSLHTDKMGVWGAWRARNGYPPAKAIYGHEGTRGQGAPYATHTTDWRFTGQTVTGSSGLFALKVALIDLGFDRAALCGVPMDAVFEHYFEEAPWRAALAHRQGWNQALPAIKGRARSMSGWTKALLGSPDAEWLGA